MCGIIGILSKEIDKNQVKKATNLMLHRGPDSYGFFFDKNIALGHRRLAIIDLSKKASQPMKNETGDLQIVFNGEIYNFKLIREELEKTGNHEFKSNSDTEVILHAYEQWGKNCVRRFNGMFSFAIWDSKKKELFLARDRAGEKPLYYYYDNKQFIFASEIKAILKFIKPVINKKILYDYFNYQILIGEETLFENIYSLPAGNYCTVKLNKIIGLDISSYFNLEYDIGRPKDRYYISELRKQIYESVERRLISDVPIGAFVSGGIDSSAIVAFMKKFSEKVQTFSVGSGDEVELENSRFIAEKFNTEHKEILITSEDFAKNLKKMVWHYDSPLSFASSVPLYFVAKMTKGKATVVLTGEGADELFAGYSRYARALKAKRMHQIFRFIPKPLRNLSIRSVDKVFSDPRYRKNIEMIFNGFNFDYATGINSFIGNERDKTLKSKNTYFLKKKLIDIFNEKRTSFLNKLLYLDFKTYLVELLMKQDKMSMAASIESRIPFLDPNIIEFATILPENMKLRKGEGKYILKKSMNGILPNKVIYQKKLGFPVPIDKWFRNDLNGFVNDILLKDNEIIKEHFNIGYVKKIIERQKSSDNSLQLWALINFKLWHDNFFQQA